MNPTGADRDMFAASSLTSNGNGKDSVGSSVEDPLNRVTPLDLRLTGANRASTYRFSSYAPFPNSPREPVDPNLQSIQANRSSSGLLPSLTSSPSSSLTDIPASSLRQYGSLNGPSSRERGNPSYLGRFTSQSQSQWYQQQQKMNDQSQANEMIVGSYRDSRPRQQPKI
jgi:hypothetical protein